MASTSAPIVANCCMTLVGSEHGLTVSSAALATADGQRP